MNRNGSDCITYSGVEWRQHGKLYSRQLYVMGYEVQRRMMASSALLFAVSGLGLEAEVTKNCIFAGVASPPCPSAILPFPPLFMSGVTFISKRNMLEVMPELWPNWIESTRQCTRLDTCVSRRHFESNHCYHCRGRHRLSKATNVNCRSVGVSFMYSLTSGVFSQAFVILGMNLSWVIPMELALFLSGGKAISPRWKILPVIHPLPSRCWKIMNIVCRGFYP